MIDHRPSPDTQATLLLCGYFGGKAQSEVKPLTLTEYNRVAQWLRKQVLRPRDLLDTDGVAQCEAFGDASITGDRLRQLLARGVALAFVVDEWAREGIWVVGRGDQTYPPRYKRRLKDQAPPLLYGVGDVRILSWRGMGLVGSRDAEDEALAFTRQVASTCAQQGIAVISGGAKGIDQTSMSSALKAGGYVVGVMAEGISKRASSKAYRNFIGQNQLVLVSPYHPKARWTTGNAMGRNKHIYTLSDWTLVVSSSTKGGTWSGATENVKKGWVPLLVRDGEQVPEGNRKLLRMGGHAVRLEMLQNGQSLQQLLEHIESLVAPKSPTLFSEVEEHPYRRVGEQTAQDKSLEPQDGERARSAVPDQQATPGEQERHVLSQATGDGIPVPGRQPEPLHIGDLFSVVWPHLAGALSQERTDAEMAKLFHVQIGQMRSWLKQAVEDGTVTKRKGSRYQIVDESPPALSARTKQ